MNTGLTRAAEHLADTLTQENAALAALDLRRAGALLAAKQHALAAFTTALAGSSLHEADRSLATRLRSLTDENKTLLERAMAAQGRVIAIFARAVARQSGYCRPCGGRSSAERPVPFAFAAQA